VYLAAAVPEPSDREFAAFRDLVERTSGIHLAPSKKALLYSRLAKRVRELRMPSFDAYYHRIVAGDAAELVQMLDRISTNETHFFREPHHFTYLEDVLLPEWCAAAQRGTRGRHVRVWSAGCSTGQEPYSIAMVLLARLPSSEGWTVDILGTDLSTRALAAAREGVWPSERTRDIPAAYLRRFMLRGVGAQSGRVSAGPELRHAVHFDRYNLNDATYPDGERFDLVFCRNVLMYFQRSRRVYAIDRLVSRLAPGARLFLGHAESVQGTSGRLRPVASTIYARIEDDARRTP
jgi:chemotaxis protein methyltransferase CheR